MATFLEIILYIICGLYALEYLFFTSGMRRALRVRRARAAQPSSVSIVVAARNEEQNIESCLESLVAQDYPEEKTEIIAVNDESEDRTLSIMQSVAEKYPGRIKVVSTVPEKSGVGGKARAIAQGIDCSSGDLILLTDADCTPVPTWASAVADHFLPDVDLFAGYTIVRPGNLFTRLQQLDWLHLQALAGASMAYGSPVGVVGNNMAFRRDAYEKVGGYRGIHFSVTEDFALFKAMHYAGARAVYSCSYDSHVITEPCRTLSAVMQQKHRWGRGGMESSLHGYSILLLAFLMLLALTIAPFVSPLAWAIVWGTKFCADLLLLLPVMKELRQMGGLQGFIPFQFYFIVQAVVVPILLPNRNVTWKGRVFRTAGPRVIKS